MKVYVASSWRNARQPYIVDALREDGHEVYDFRHPPSGTGFAWREVGLAPDRATIGGGDTVPASDFLDALAHPRAIAGFDSDFAAMKWADACVMVLPCGRSAHLELGWAAGAGKRTVVLLDDPCTPELMYWAANLVTESVPEVLRFLRRPVPQRAVAVGDTVTSRAELDAMPVGAVLLDAERWLWLKYGAGYEDGSEWQCGGAYGRPLPAARLVDGLPEFGKTFGPFTVLYLPDQVSHG